MYWRVAMIDCPSEQISQECIECLQSEICGTLGQRRAVLQAAGPNKLMVDSEHACNRVEAAFKRKEDVRAEGLKANEEYEAGQRAMREARLRALRLARDLAKK
jgi:hypothetical protein